MRQKIKFLAGIFISLVLSSTAISAPRCDLVTGACYKLNAGEACKILDDDIIESIRCELEIQQKLFISLKSVKNLSFTCLYSSIPFNFPLGDPEIMRC